MLCPYPATCIHDQFRLTGVHFCSSPKCPYRMTAKAMLQNEIGLLSRIRHKTPGQKAALEKLRKKYLEEFGGDEIVSDT